MLSVIWGVCCKVKTFAWVVLFIFFTGIEFSFSDQFFPPTESPVKLAELTLKEIPGVARKYNLDRLVNRFALPQIKLVRALKSFEGFEDRVKMRPGLIEVQIYKKVKIKEQRLQPIFEKWEGWEGVFSFLENLSTDYPKGISREVLLHEARDCLELLLRLPLNGLMVGVLKVFDEEQKQKVFALPSMEDRIELLETLEVSKEDFSKVFEASRYGFKSDTTFNDVLGKMKDLIEIDRDLQHLILLLSVLESIEGQESDLVLWDDFQEELKKIETGNFSSVLGSEKGKNEFIDRLKKHLLSGAVEKFFSKKVSSKKIDQTFKEVVSRYFGTREVDVVGERLEARVVEVPPYLGIFRGCFGRDCSTSSSWAYPYSPYEHVFYVYNQKEDIAGYVAATIVQVNGRRNFYLRDLVGKLSERLSKAVIHAIHSSLPLYGLESMTLSVPRWINSENRSLAKQGLLDYAVRGDVVRQEYEDQEIRDVIVESTGISRNYDRPIRHRQGVRFDADPKIMKAFSFKVSLAGGNKLELGSMATLILAMENDVDLSGIEGFDPSVVLAIRELLPNPEAHSIEDYYGELSRLFGLFGIKLSSRLRQKYSSLFTEGHLRSADAFHGKNSRASEKMLESYLRTEEVSEWVRPIISQNRAELSKSEFILRAIEVFKDRGSDADLKKLLFLGNLGITPATDVLGGSSRVTMKLRRFFKQESLDFIVEHAFEGERWVNELNQIIEQSSEFSLDEFEKQLTVHVASFGLPELYYSTVRRWNRVIEARLKTKDFFTGEYRKTRKGSADTQYFSNLVVEKNDAVFEIIAGMDSAHPIRDPLLEESIKNMVKKSLDFSTLIFLAKLESLEVESARVILSQRSERFRSLILRQYKSGKIKKWLPENCTDFFNALVNAEKRSVVEYDKSVTETRGNCGELVNYLSFLKSYGYLESSNVLEYKADPRFLEQLTESFETDPGYAVSVLSRLLVEGETFEIDRVWGELIGILTSKAERVRVSGQLPFYLDALILMSLMGSAAATQFIEGYSVRNMKTLYREGSYSVVYFGTRGEVELMGSRWFQSRALGDRLGALIYPEFRTEAHLRAVHWALDFALGNPGLVYKNIRIQHAIRKSAIDIEDSVVRVKAGVLYLENALREIGKDGVRGMNQQLSKVISFDLVVHLLGKVQLSEGDRERLGEDLLRRRDSVLEFFDRRVLLDRDVSSEKWRTCNELLRLAEVGGQR